MSTLNAIKRAYKLLEERNWDKVYWCIDLHGVCLKSTYNDTIEFINEDAVKTLQLISSLDETVIILWSSCYKDYSIKITDLFLENSIKVKYFNENKDITSTDYAYFGDKFYFDILLDDKAGFDANTEWKQIYEHLNKK